MSTDPWIKRRARSASQRRLSRRCLLRRSPLGLAAFALAACNSPSHSSPQQSAASLSKAEAQPPSLRPTPACGSGLATPAQTPGPFYTPNSPQRQSLLEADTVGERLVLTGQVLTTGCGAIANCLVDVWQTNAQGEYDNDGYHLRGHQFTDSEGRYWLETIVPGQYPGRTRHLHIRLQAPDGSGLTTQLYLPQERSENEADFLFVPELLMQVEDGANGPQAQFDFVLEPA